jgi:hypothetical protein
MYGLRSSRSFTADSFTREDAQSRWLGHDHLALCCRRCDRLPAGVRSRTNVMRRICPLHLGPDAERKVRGSVLGCHGLVPLRSAFVVRRFISRGRVRPHLRSSGWLSANLAPDAARASGIAVGAVFQNIGGLISSWTYLSKVRRSCRFTFVRPYSRPDRTRRASSRVTASISRSVRPLAQPSLPQSEDRQVFSLFPPSPASGWCASASPSFTWHTR